VSDPSPSAAPLRFAVLGHPVAHSKSPQMHRAAYALLGIEARYEAIDLSPAQLGPFLTGQEGAGYRGLNLTLPHKEAVLSALRAAGALGELSPTAQALGAVNTLTRRADGRWEGDNTDAPGLRASLEEAGVPLDGARGVVIGAGGAAAAAAAALALGGATELELWARRPERAEALALRLESSPLFAGCALRAAALPPQAALSGRVVVNATPLGLRADDPSPVALVEAPAWAVDLIYGDPPSAFARQAAALGASVTRGEGMLVHQGALALARWIGCQVTPALLRAMAGALA